MTAAPPTVTTLKGEYAGFATRLVAFLVDIIVISTTIVVTSASSQLLLDFTLGRFSLNPNATDLIQQGRTAVLVLFAVLLPPLYSIFFWTLIGQTPGKILMGVRLVQLSGERVTLARAIMRYLGYFVSAFLLLGYLWMLVDNRRQAWHDKLARTVVIYTWEGERGKAFRRIKQARARVRAPGRDRLPLP
jgi:uncharacterized RDD family membrane protein YckC